MAAGISGDVLLRVEGNSCGLGNKTKEVTVTCELGEMGLYHKLKARGVRK